MLLTHTAPPLTLMRAMNVRRNTHHPGSIALLALFRRTGGWSKSPSTWGWRHVSPKELGNQPRRFVSSPEWKEQCEMASSACLDTENFLAGVQIWSILLKCSRSSYSSKKGWALWNATHPLQNVEQMSEPSQQPGCWAVKFPAAKESKASPCADVHISGAFGSRSACLLCGSRG